MLSIGFVASNLGISTSTLRKWEERYGFPKPVRSEGGARWYDETDLIALRQAKRLIDRGIRASRVFADSDALVAAVEEAAHYQETAKRSPPQAGPIAELVDLLTQHRVAVLQARLQKAFDRLGPESFVESIAAPWMRAIGEGWASGEIDVFQEHSAATLLANVLGNPPVRSPSADTPTLLLTTPPDERHALSLAMVATVLHEAGGRCINLGPSLPLTNLLDAARAFDADIIGLSISSVTAGRLTRRFIAELRDRLPSEVKVWVGGSGAALMPTLPDHVRAFLDTREPAALVRDWSHTAENPSIGVEA